MNQGDFYESEKSITVVEATDVKIQFVGSDGATVILKESTPLFPGEIIDTSVLNLNQLKKFIAEEIEDAKIKEVLFSVHLKATMMKVSDPIIFGAVVSVFYKSLFEEYADLFDELGVTPNNGIGDVYAKISGHKKEDEVSSN